MLDECRQVEAHEQDVSWHRALGEQCLDQLIERGGLAHLTRSAEDMNQGPFSRECGNEAVDTAAAVTGWGRANRVRWPPP